jgi:hypothetical protein
MTHNERYPLCEYTDPFPSCLDKMRHKNGDVIEYFETDNNKEGYSLNSQDIRLKKYKIML